jgi:hypothetical protein
MQEKRSECARNVTSGGRLTILPIQEVHTTIYHVLWELIQKEAEHAKT